MLNNTICSFAASDCFEIGRYAYERGDKYHALQWLMEALGVHELEEGLNSMDLILLLDYLIYAADDVSLYVGACAASPFPLPGL